jgi:uncharacterized protein YkwD
MRLNACLRTCVALGSALTVALVLFTLVPSSPRAYGAGDCTADGTLDSEEKAFLVLINNHRAQNGRQPLGVSYTLSLAAQWKSNDLGANAYFAHDDLNRTWVQRIRDCGYGYNTYLGENIAAGNSSAQATFNQWKNSPGHNANMLSANFSTIGIGRAFTSGSPYGWYWTTEFGGVDDGYVTIAAPSSSDDSARLVSPSPSVSARRLRNGTYILSAHPADRRNTARVEFLADGIVIATDRRAPFVVVWRDRHGRSPAFTAVAYTSGGTLLPESR